MGVVLEPLGEGGVDSIVAVVPIDVFHPAKQAFNGLPIGIQAMLRDTLAGTLAQLFHVPSRFRHSDDGNIECPAHFQSFQ